MENSADLRMLPMARRPRSSPGGPAA